MDFNNFLSNNLKEILKINTPAEPTAPQVMEEVAPGSSLSDPDQQADGETTDSVEEETADVVDVLAGGDSNHVAPTNDNQIIDLATHTDGSFIHLLNRNIVIKASPQTETTSESKGSSKIKNTTVTKFEWERKYQMGNLLSLTNKYFSYAIKGMNGFCVRVMTKDNSARLLLKGMTNTVADMSFYDPKSSLLAVVDTDCNFFIFCLKNDGSSEATSDLILHIKPPTTPTSNHRINWIANPDLNKMDLSDDIGLLSNSELYPPVLLVLTYGTYAEIWNLNTAYSIREKMGRSVFNRDELKIAFTTIDNEDVLVSDCELSPNGSVLALSGFDGHVKFWQVDPQTETETEPEELHCWKPHGDVQVSALKFLDNSTNDTDVFWRFVMTGCNKNRELKIWCTVTWNCLQTIQFDPSTDSCENLPEMKIAVSSPTSEFLLVSDIQRNVLYAFRTVLNTEHEYAAFVTLSYYQLTAPIISLDFINIIEQNGKSKNKKSIRSNNDEWNDDPHDDDSDLEFSSESDSVSLVSSYDEKSVDGDVKTADDFHGDDDDVNAGVNTGDEGDDVTNVADTKEYSLNFLSIQPRTLSTMEATFISPQTRPNNPLDESMKKSKDVQQQEASIKVNPVQVAEVFNITGSSVDIDEANDSGCQHVEEIDDVVKEEAEEEAEDNNKETNDDEMRNPNTTWPPSSTTGGCEPDLTSAPATPQSSSKHVPQQQPVLLTPDAFMNAAASSSNDVTNSTNDDVVDLNQSSATSLTKITPYANSECSPKVSPLKTTMKNPLQDSSIDSSFVDLPSTSHHRQPHDQVEKSAASQSIIDMLANAQKEVNGQQQRPNVEQYLQRSLTIARSPDIISSTSTMDGGNEAPQQPPQVPPQQPTPSSFEGASSSNHASLHNQGEGGSSQQSHHQSAPQQSTHVTSPKSSWSIAPDVTMPLMSSSSSSSSSLLANKSSGGQSCVMKAAPNSISYQSLPSRGPRVETSTATTPSSSNRNSYQSSSSTSRSQGASTSSTSQQPPPRQQQADNNEQQHHEQISRMESVTSETKRSLEELETARTSLKKDMKNMEALFKQGVENINRLYADTQQKMHIMHGQQTEQIGRLLHSFNERHNSMYIQQNQQLRELILMSNNLKQLVEDQKKQLRDIHQQNLVNENNRNIMMDNFAKDVNYKLIPKSVKGFEGILADVKDNMLKRIQEHDRSIQMHINNLCSSPETVKRIVDGVTREMMDQCTGRIPELMRKSMIEPIEVLSKNMYRNFAEVYHNGLEQLVNDADQKFHQKMANEQTNLTKMISDVQTMNDKLKSVRSNDYCQADEHLSNTIVSRMGQFMEAMVPRITAAVTEVVEKISLEAEVKSTANNNGNNVDIDGNNGNGRQSVVQIKDRIRDLVMAEDLNEAFRVALSASDLNIVVYLCGMLEPQTMYPCPLTQPILLSLIQQLATDLTSDLELKIKFLQMSMMSLDPKHKVTSGYLGGVIENLHKCLLNTLEDPGVKDNMHLRRDIAMLTMACKAFLH